MKRLGELD